METTVQIVVVDDSQPFRVGLRALLAATEGMELIGEAILRAQNAGFDR